MNGLSWSWILLGATVPSVVALIAALPFWLKDQPILGNLAGTVILFGAAFALIMREHFTLERAVVGCLDAGLPCFPNPPAFTRYAIYAFVALFEVAPYSASKAAVASLTKSLAIEWAPYGVCVNAIAPGVFQTPLNEKLLQDTPRGNEFKMRTPMKRFGKVEELAGAAIFLASDAASFVTGEILVVDGGFLASGVNQ